MNRLFFTEYNNIIAAAFDTASSGDDMLAINLKVDKADISRVKQIHSAEVKVVTSDNRYERTPADGMVTNEKNIPLVIQTADCVPVLLFDPVKNVIGVVHSGRKGCAQEIMLEAIKKFTHVYGCSLQDIRIGIGPCICKDCYEVGGELMSEFDDFFTPEQIHTMFIPKDNGKYVMNMKRAILYTLKKAGIRQEQIDDCQICTLETPEFTSYRRHCHNDKKDAYNENRTAIMLL